VSILFEPSSHTYVSTDPKDTTRWISVTTLLGALKKPFDSKNVSTKSAANKRSKWFGMTPEQIQQIWKKETERACNLGNWYHDQRERDILGCQTIVRHDTELPVIRPMQDENGKKIASSQKLINGIYPEHLVYLRSVGICGQSDLVEIVNGQVFITDYKTNKEIKKESFKNWEGVSQKMNQPVSHLDDCNLNHYTLQLSIYLYMILKHNPTFKPGKLTIHHILFEEEDQKDEYGYPILKTNTDGDFIIREIVPYELPYLKDEVLAIMTWYKDNQDKVLKTIKHD
jgi:ATP-dependent exoDNAse (exonuclease V) beta subunit